MTATELLAKTLHRKIPEILKSYIQEVMDLIDGVPIFLSEKEEEKIMRFIDERVAKTAYQNGKEELKRNRINDVLILSTFIRSCR